MRISVSSPDDHLEQREIDEIHQGLEKIDRRLHEFKEEVRADVRVKNEGSAPERHVVVELNYGRTHLIAKAENDDLGQAVRQAREDLLRQINDRSRGGHSDFAKRAPGRTP
jgi:ribosome-associated translation inhibitor RaiA